MLCHIRLAPRRLAFHILKEVKQLFKLMGSSRSDTVSSNLNLKIQVPVVQLSKICK